jgi:hypothetical protein
MNGMIKFVLIYTLVVYTPVAMAVGEDNYNFDLMLDTAKGILSGTAEVEYLNNSSLALVELRFRLDVNLSLADTMRVISVKDADGGNLEWSYGPLEFGTLSSDKGVLIVTLAQALKSGGTAKLEIEYQFVCKPALGSAMTLLQDDPYTSLDSWYPKAMSFRDGGWSYDDDRPADYDITIEMPEELAFATTGEIMEEQAIGEGMVKYRLKAERVRGFTIYGSKFWKVFHGEAGDVKIRCFISEVSEQWAPRFIEAVADAVEYYGANYPPYPSKRLDMICPSVSMGQGHGSFACCNVIGLFLGGRLEEQYRWLLAHEVAHQYWGNLVNQPRDQVNWVLLGLGMVMDRHFLSDTGLDPKWLGMIVEIYTRVKKQGRNTSLSQSVGDLYRAEEPWSMQWNLAMAHAKAYAVCSMLEDLLGEEDFKGVIRRIISGHAHGLVTPADLMRYCQESYGSDLSWFAADWIEGDATLDYGIADVAITDEGVEVKVERLGSAAYPVVVEATSGSGAKSRLRVPRDGAESALLFQTDEEIISVVIDPDGIYPDMDPGNNTWMKPVTEQ